MPISTKKKFANSVLQFNSTAK